MYIKTLTIRMNMFASLENIFEPPHDKTNKMTVRPLKTAQSDQSLLCAQWVAKNPSFLHEDSKDSDQTGWMPRLICLRWAHMPFCWFCRDVAHFMPTSIMTWQNILHYIFIIAISLEILIKCRGPMAYQVCKTKF